MIRWFVEAHVTSISPIMITAERSVAVITFKTSLNAAKAAKNAHHVTFFRPRDIGVGETNAKSGE